MQQLESPEERPPTVGEEFRETLDSRARIFISVVIDALLLLGGAAVLWVVQEIGPASRSRASSTGTGALLKSSSRLRQYWAWCSTSRAT